MKPRLFFPVLLLSVFALAAGGCASTKTKEKAPPAPLVTLVPAPTWSKTELYFSIGEWETTALSTEAEERWTTFLEKEVTPRFPEGFTVIDAYGQWRGAETSAKIQRERSRVLVILHQDTPEALSKIEALRTAWKQVSKEESVLRVTEPADVSF